LIDFNQGSCFQFKGQLKHRAGLLLLLVALFAAPAIAPLRAFAQEPATQAQSATKAPAKSEADETEAFRHSPTVQWVAKTLNIPVETTAKSLELKGTFPLGDPIWGNGAGVGMRKGDTKLIKQINDGIRALYKDGTFAKMEKKYFTYEIGTPPKD